MLHDSSVALPVHYRYYKGQGPCLFAVLTRYVLTYISFIHIGIQRLRDYIHGSFVLRQIFLEHFSKQK